MNGSSEELRHVALEIDPEYVVIHGTNLKEDDLVAIGRLLGVVEE
jgi:hypothetical protein